jgi:hypothetical protein
VHRGVRAVVALVSGVAVLISACAPSTGAASGLSLFVPSRGVRSPCGRPVWTRRPWGATGSPRAQAALHTTLRVTAPHRKIGYFAPHGPDAGGRRHSARLEGFSLHADVAVPARRWDRLERLVRYLVRPPLALDRLTESTGGRLLYQFRRPGRSLMLTLPSRTRSKVLPSLIPSTSL